MGNTTVSTRGAGTCRTYEGVLAKELCAAFREEKLVGATLEPNNAVWMLQGFFGYHNDRYM